MKASKSLMNFVGIADTALPAPPSGSKDFFSTQYREKIFYIWYNHGKPGSVNLLRFITPNLDDFERIPTKSALNFWITEEFKPRAELMDKQIKDQMNALLVKEKVEMLRRHAEIGLKMQNIAIDYLNENLDELSAPAAVRLLVEGIRIERESRGIPDALDKMQSMTDEDLMKEVQHLITTASTLEEIDANNG